MSVYPTNIVSLPTWSDEVDVVAASIVNTFRDEVIALQTYIGTNPHGSKNNLTDRLAVLMATNGAIAQSNAFPATPVEGQAFWRTDLITLYVYGNSVWNSMGQSLSNSVFEFWGDPYLTAQPAGYSTIYHSFFKKISGISTILGYVLPTETSGNVGFGRFSVGAVTSPLTQTLNGVWGSASLDVSGLNNGTTYRIVLEMQAQTGTCSAIGIKGIAS